MTKTLYDGQAAPLAKLLMDRNAARRHIATVCEALDCDPFRIMAQIAMDLDLKGDPAVREVAVKTSDGVEVIELEGYDPALRMEAAKELAKYLAPQLKSIEFSAGEEGADGQKIPVQIVLNAPAPRWMPGADRPKEIKNV